MDNPGLQVSACGYLAPGKTLSDHSLLWMDVTFESALGHNPPTPQTFRARRLKLYDTKITNRYLDNYESALQHGKVIPRQIRLKKQVRFGQPLTPAQAQEADAIDYLKTKAMKKAEKTCRKLRMGRVDFSLATESPRRRISFWALALKRKQNKRVSSRLWRRKKRKAKVTELVGPLTTQDIQDRLTQARLDCRAAKKRHKEERVAFLESLPKKDRQRFIQTEQQRALGRIAKAVTGKLANSGVIKVEYQGAVCTTRLEVETALLTVNAAKYRACEDTPFLNEPLLSEFGLTNDTEATQQVLNGTYQCPEGTDKYAALLLKHLSRPPLNPNATPFTPRTSITVADHVNGWKKAKERTSPGKSGLHFGMYKAHLKRPVLAALDASMRSIAYMTGFAYKRWKQVVDVALLKRKKDFRAEKLRTIALMEADFNMNNKALGNDTMKAGESQRIFTRDNYGGRHGHQACEVALNSRLTYDSI